MGGWEPDAFVVETTGLQDEAWLDFQGHPASDAMHITERFRRINLGEMDVEFTFNDPKAYSRPWAVNVGLPMAEAPLDGCDQCLDGDRLSEHARKVV